MNAEGKKILIIGTGKSGIAAAQLLLAKKAVPVLFDGNEKTDPQEVRRKLPEGSGVKVLTGELPDEELEGISLAVFSPGVPVDTPFAERIRKRGIPVWGEVELGYAFLKGRLIAITGTNGKTTTTALLTQMLMECGMDPSAVVGGKLPAIGGSGRLGSSDIMTCEACEFEDHFLKLHPDIAVILNVDADHMEYFKTMDHVIASYHQFAQMATKAVIYNGEDANACKAVEGVAGKKMLTFGMGENNDYYPKNIVHTDGRHTRYDLYCRGENLGTVLLNVPGDHNILNSISAIAAAIEVGCGVQQAIASASVFQGAGRRFEIMGENKGVTIADDYGHHPAEIEATLKAAKAMDYRAVWAVHQPFTYSRTAMLLDDFARVLQIADHVVLSEIMGSREKNTYNIYAKDLADKIPGCVWFETFEEISAYVMSHAQPGDLVITLGCGDVYKCAKLMLHQK